MAKGVERQRSLLVSQVKSEGLVEIASWLKFGYRKYEFVDGVNSGESFVPVWNSHRLTRILMSLTRGSA